jgi:hypothetical protein
MMQVALPLNGGSAYFYFFFLAAFAFDFFFKTSPPSIQITLR